MYNEQQKDFVKKIINSLTESKLSLFTGAGTSMSAGLPSWVEFFDELCKQQDISIKNSQYDLYTILSFLKNQKQFNDDKIKKYIKRQLADCVLKMSKNPFKDILQQAMYDLNADSFWTTNWDTVYADFVQSVEKMPANIIYRDAEIVNADVIKQKTIYHLNGYIGNLESLVVDKQDYNKYFQQNEGLITFLKKELITHTFLFIGYSFADNLMLDVLSQVRNFKKDTHYAILVDNGDPNFIHFQQNLEENYGIISFVINPQDNQEINSTTNNNDLQDNENTKAIPKQTTNQYITSQVVQILTLIKESIARKQIYISGSLYDYDEDAKQEMKCLSQAIVEQLFKSSYDYKIANSLGHGLTQRLIGQIAHYCSQNNERLDRRLVIRHGDFDSKNHQEKYQLRKQLIQTSGIIIFMYGNDSKIPALTSNTNHKTNDNEPFQNISTGVWQEYLVARELSNLDAELDKQKTLQGTNSNQEITQNATTNPYNFKRDGIKIIPLGSTGYTAQKIWQDMNTQLINYPYLEKGVMDKLNTEKDPQKLAELVVKIIKDINEKYPL